MFWPTFVDQSLQGWKWNEKRCLHLIKVIIKDYLPLGERWLTLDCRVWTQAGHFNAPSLHGGWRPASNRLHSWVQAGGNIATGRVDAWNCPNFSTENSTPWEPPPSQASQECGSPSGEVGQITHWLLKLLFGSKTQHFFLLQWLKHVRWPQRSPRRGGCIVPTTAEGGDLETWGLKL